MNTAPRSLETPQEKGPLKELIKAVRAPLAALLVVLGVSEAGGRMIEKDTQAMIEKVAEAKKTPVVVRDSPSPVKDVGAFSNPAGKAPALDAENAVASGGDD